MLRPTISVCMITYGHEKYIREAIEGVLMQECDFEIELILANDCSPDSTDEVIQDILKNHPRKSWIKYFNHEKNIGMMPNFIDAFKKSEGKYVALCEGDDYWTDSLKLQKQVDFLEVNPEYTICFHKVNILQEGIVKEDIITVKVPETTTINDLAKGNYIHTCSVVFKNNLFEKFPKYFEKSPVGDYFLHMLNARYGKIKHLDEFMGVYRLHDSSVWSSQDNSKREKIWIHFLKNIKPNFNSEVQGIIKNQISKYKALHIERRKLAFKKIIRKLYNLLK
ncbi:glycosyltransferase [Flavobacterium sp. M31R6]|uniref:glycosyltransferase family 2 protein n=1 Tax=Flavobacterium sp. M31R6 TaxID=2739062 RepID=UPI00156A57CC|nr:glycosyltransferase [Flavobacterium sp. M31R6]QKJ64804.1 glycosyltransferase [Flavobacterium sp. M31R6]